MNLQRRVGLLDLGSLVKLWVVLLQR